MSRFKRTSTKNLRQQKSDGQFYLVAKIKGKTEWEALGTNIRTVAEDKLRDRLKQLRRGGPVEAGADYTFSQALDRVLAERKLQGLDEKTLTDDAAIHERIKTSFAQCDMLVRKIDVRMLKTYFANLAKKDGSPISNSYFNRILGRIREVFQRAEGDGLIYANPATKIKRRRNVYSPPTIIILGDFHLVLGAMRSSGGRAVQGADTVEFMGYSGTRINEARNIRWTDVGEKTIIVRHPKGQNQGTPAREIPIIPEMAALLERLRAKRKPGEQFVLRCKSCLGSLKTACAKLGLPTLTHHDFRHFFATCCIKAGIDVATVAQLLGHKDRGVTLLRTYTHVCGQHVKEAVKKLDFSAPSREQQLAILPKPEIPKANALAVKHGWERPEGYTDRYIPTTHTNLYRVTATGEYATFFTLRGRSFRKNLKTWDEAQALKNRDSYYRVVGKPVAEESMAA